MLVLLMESRKVVCAVQGCALSCMLSCVCPFGLLAPSTVLTVR